MVGEQAVEAKEAIPDGDIVPEQPDTFAWHGGDAAGNAFLHLGFHKAVKIYRIVFVIFVAVGAMLELEVVWKVADIMNGLMAFPNLIGLIGLSTIIVAETNKHYYHRKR